MDLRKMAGFLVSGAAAGALGLVLASTAFAQSDVSAAAATTKSTKITTAVGTLTVTSFSSGSCPGVTCPGVDTCENETLTGTSKNFNRFGGFKGNTTLTVCETIDTTVRDLANGCAPAAGIGTLASTTASVTFGLSGTDCTLPGGTATAEAFNQVGAITNSTASKISTGSGSFVASDDAGVGFFNLTAVYSK